MNTARAIATLVLSVLIAASARAQMPGRPRPTTRPAPAGPPATAPATGQKLSDRLSVSEHEMTINGQALHYRATAGYLPVKDESGRERASFFFVAYEKIGGEPVAQRPITFVFNGGPGAAAVWLHLGAAGPKRVALKNESGEPPSPPYRLVDNDATWLDVTDLVFIDPVGTGYSRPAPGEKGEQFWGVREDVASVADFIRMYTTRYERWLSPKFLAGESYGTTRAAGLSEYLVDHSGIALNGIVLISTVLDFQTLAVGSGGDLPYALYLPSYTATAWQHKRLAPDLQQDLARTLKEVEVFAMGDYLDALLRGGDLPADRRKTVVEKLARYTALPADFIDRAELRIAPDVFRKMLLQEQRRVVGRFDTRITGQDLNPTSTSASYDPSLPGYLALYTATFNSYVRTDLRFESELPYEVLSDRVGPWNFGRPGSGFLNVTPDLRSAMVKLPHLKVLVASGYFDLATPYLATRYTVDHLAVTPELRASITQAHYTGGHMLYHTTAGRERLKQDIAAFIRKSTGS